MATFNGSCDTSILTKPTQIYDDDTSYVSYYDLDNGKLKLWQNNSETFQTPIANPITNMCTLYFNQNDTCIATLDNDTCQIYKLSK